MGLIGASRSAKSVCGFEKCPGADACSAASLTWANLKEPNTVFHVMELGSLCFLHHCIRTAQSEGCAGGRVGVSFSFAPKKSEQQSNSLRPHRRGQRELLLPRLQPMRSWLSVEMRPGYVIHDRTLRAVGALGCLAVWICHDLQLGPAALGCGDWAEWT